MRGRIRSRILAVLLLAAAVVIVWWPRKPSTADPQRLADLSEMSTPAAPPPSERAAGERSAVRAELGPPQLSAAAITLDGAPLPQAHLHADGPGGFFHDAHGAATWELIRPGEWTVTASAEGYFPTTETAPTTPGEITEVRLELRPSALIRGHVLTTFGRAWPGLSVWFLCEGEQHPARPGQEGDLLTVRTGREGDFVSPPLQGGPWRVSLGPAGVKRMETPESILLEEGQPREVTIHMERGNFVRVAVDGLQGDDHAACRVSLLEKRVRRDEELWEEYSSERAPPPDRTVAFWNIRPGEYRVQVLAGGWGRFQTDQLLKVEPTEAASARVRLFRPNQRTREFLAVPLAQDWAPEDLPAYHDPGFTWSPWTR